MDCACAAGANAVSSNTAISTCNIQTTLFFFKAIMLVYHFKTGIAVQYFRQCNSFCCLIVLQQCSHYARQCQRASVEGMCKLFFSFCIFETKFQPVALKCFEIGYRTYF